MVAKKAKVVKKKAPVLKTVKPGQVMRLAHEDKQFFSELTKDPEAALAKRGWKLAPKDLKRVVGVSGVPGVPCVFNLKDVIKKLKQMGWTWPDGHWKGN